MKYLILSDIHSNIDALNAIDEEYDDLLVLGDLVDYGASPIESVAWVKARASSVVSGNHDFAMATGADCKSSPVSHALSVATREFFRPEMDENSLDLLRSMPLRNSIDANGAVFHLVHATPRDPLYEYLNGDADENVWLAAVGNLAQQDAWLFLGHTHRPFVRKIGKLTVVNPGSLGMPVDGDPRGCYAVWEDGKISLRRIKYDLDRAVRRLFDSGMPSDIAKKMEAVLRNAGRTG